MAWIAVDAGTSVIKAVVYAEDGHEVAVARKTMAVIHPRSNQCEQEMNEVWLAVVATVREAAAQCSETIRGIVTTAQGDGCWLIDESGHPTGNAILWNDGSAVDVVENWQCEGRIDRGFRISGSVTYPGLASAILAWLHQHQPQRVKTARWMLSCNGWLFSKLTGRFAADLSDASNPFSNVLSRTYSKEAIALYGAASDARLLPPICTGDDRIGDLGAAAAEQLGLPVGVQVVMAPYDIVSTAYGCGAVETGQACVILGTTICAEAITSSIDLAAEPSGTTIALDDKLYLRAMPTLTGCEALQWTSSLLGLGSISDLDALASGCDAIDQKAFFLPYLSPAGERSPFLAPEARGSFHGLSISTSRAEVARCAFDGLSFVIRECIEAAISDPLQDLRVCGGGARSDLWCQIIADVSGVQVIRPAGAEAGALGAYLFALALTGAVENIAEGSRLHIRNPAVFSPDQAMHSFYDRRFRTFCELREHARDLWLSSAGLP